MTNIAICAPATPITREQQAALNEMANTATRLLVVTQDFLLHEEPRAVVQWELLQTKQSQSSGMSLF